MVKLIFLNFQTCRLEQVVQTYVILLFTILSVFCRNYWTVKPLGSQCDCSSFLDGPKFSIRSHVKLIYLLLQQIDEEFEKLPCPPSPLLFQSGNGEGILEHQLNGYEKFEEMIGYTFRDRSYLLQAFTHASYHYNTVTDCYQR